MIIGWCPALSELTTMAPPARPYSAGATLVFTLNSCVASIVGEEQNRVHQAVVVVHAVQNVVVRLGAKAVD